MEGFYNLSMNTIKYNFKIARTPNQFKNRRTGCYFKFKNESEYDKERYI